MKILNNVIKKKEQKKLVFEVIKIINKAQPFIPLTPIWNKPLKISITNAGKWGWFSDKKRVSVC